MEPISQAQRRKGLSFLPHRAFVADDLACDLCFVKKIKCDMLKPVCSNCILYKSKCQTTTVRRRTMPTKERAPAASSELVRRPFFRGDSNVHQE